MGLFNFLTKDKEVKQKNYTFSDEDREFSKEIRERKKQIELAKLDEQYSLEKLRLEKQKLELQRDIDKIKEEYEDDEDIPDVSDNSAENELIKLFAPMLIKNINQPAPVPQTTSSASETPLPKNSVSDAELNSLWDKTPLQAKQFVKTITDEELKIHLAKQLPNADADTINRAVSIIRG